MHKAVDAALQHLKRAATPEQMEAAFEYSVNLKETLKEVRGEGDPSSILWNVTTKAGAESLAVVNPACCGVLQQVGQLDQSGCYLAWFQSMGWIFPELAQLAKDPHAVLRASPHCSLSDDVFIVLSTKRGMKIWYTRLYGKMERFTIDGWWSLRVISRLLRVLNAVYVALIIKQVLKDNPHLTFVASASDSITFKGFKDHAEFRLLSANLSSMAVLTDKLKEGVLAPCDKSDPRAFSVEWKRELPHANAVAGLAVGIFSRKCNLYFLTNPRDPNPETNTKVVPQHMFTTNLEKATNYPAADGGAAENIDPQELLECMKQAAIVVDPAQAHSALLRVLKDFFPRKRKGSYLCKTKAGKFIKTTPWACQLLMDATRSSSLSSSSLSKRDPAIARQAEIGGFVVQEWHNDGGKEYLVVQDLRDCLKGCYHPLFVGRGVFIRAVVDYDLPMPLKEEWIEHLQNALRRFWSANGQEVLVCAAWTTTLRTDPKKTHSSHIMFRCLREEDRVECVFACVEDVLKAFQTYLDKVFDFPMHNPIGKFVGDGPWEFADVFDTKIYRTGASLRSAGSCSANEEGLFGAHVPLGVHAYMEREGALPNESMLKYWRPTEEEFDRWSFLVRGPREQFVVHGRPRDMTAAAACRGLLLPSEITGQRILEEYVKLFYPGWVHKFVPGVHYYPSSSLPDMRSTVICRCCVNAPHQLNRNVDFYQLFSAVLLPRLATLENGNTPPPLENARKAAGKVPCHTNNSFISLYYDWARKRFSEARGDTMKAHGEREAKRKHKEVTGRQFFRRNDVANGSVDVLGRDLEHLLGELPAETREALRADLDTQVRTETERCIKVENITLHKTDSKTLDVNVYDIRDAFMYRHALHKSRKEGSRASKKKRKATSTLSAIQREMLSQRSRRALATIVCFLVRHDHALAAKTIAQEKNVYQQLPHGPNCGAVLAFLEKKQQDISKITQIQCSSAFAPALFLAIFS